MTHALRQRWLKDHAARIEDHVAARHFPGSAEMTYPYSNTEGLTELDPIEAIVPDGWEEAVAALALADQLE